MTTKSTIVGGILICAVLLLPIAGWRLSIKAYKDDHMDDTVERLLNAAEAGDTSTVRRLLDLKINVDSGQKDGVTPLLLAACSGKAELVKLLLERGANVEATYDPTSRAMTRGVMSKQVQNVSFAVPGDTALLIAARKGDCAIVEILLGKGADVNYKNSKSLEDLRNLARSQPKPDLVDLLVERGIKIEGNDSQGASLLMWAIEKNDAKLARTLLKQNADVDNLDVNRQTALLLAARSDFDPELTCLIANRAKDLNVMDGKRGTPLSYAILFSRTQLIKTLLQRGADANLADGSSTTPLIAAVQKGNPEIVKMLVQAGANTRLADKNGMTAQKWAEARSFTSIVSILKSAKSQ